jgi:hypothetical protein
MSEEMSEEVSERAEGTAAFTIMNGDSWEAISAA